MGKSCTLGGQVTTVTEDPVIWSLMDTTCDSAVLVAGGFLCDPNTLSASVTLLSASWSEKPFVANGDIHSEHFTYTFLDKNMEPFPE